MAKSLSTAKQWRERQLMEFQTSCENLDEEVDKDPPSERKINTKLKLVKASYEEVMTAQSQVVSLEKTSASDDVNRSWVKDKVRKPYVAVVEKAEDKLETMGADDDQDTKAKAEAAQVKRDAEFELATFEAGVRATVNGLEKAIGETNIWLVENHGALTESVKGVDDELTKKHMSISRTYLNFMEGTDAGTEGKRQQTFRDELQPKVAELKARLQSKTPSVGRQPSGGSQQGLGAQQGVVQGGVQRQVQVKAKMKLAAMPVPRFSGKVVDYPEWKKLFQDCVESQYETSATVMTLRTQGLPDSLVSLVPRCASLESVWEKLDKKFLDPSRVWKGVKADLKSLDRGKLGDCKYMVALVSKLLDAESLLETVNMVHWLRQEDKIPEYEDLLNKSEKLEWVRMKPRLTGTPWENFREFLLKMRDEYEEIAKTGTVEFGEEAQAISEEKKLKCDFCKRRGHTDSDCWQKKSGGGKSDGKTEGKRTCYKCQGDDHIARDCPQKVKNSSNLVKQKKQEQKKQEVRDNTEQELFSNYLRTKDCRWCDRAYNTAFSCSGCGKLWAAKTKAEHCLAHCVKYSWLHQPRKEETWLSRGRTA